jgi:hypothetical protein
VISESGAGLRFFFYLPLPTPPRMLINSSLYLVLSILLSAVVLAVLVWLGFRSSRRWLIALGVIVSALFFGLLQVCATQVYVYSEPEGIAKYRVIGSHEWELENGSTARAEFQEIVKVTIINNSARQLILEELVYVKGGRNHPVDGSVPETDVVCIEPYSSESISLPQNKIDYFFDDELPQSIEDFGNKSTSKYWLH